MIFIRFKYKKILSVFLFCINIFLQRKRQTMAGERKIKESHLLVNEGQYRRGRQLEVARD